ncbi:MAG: pseudouridine synthase [bacterium]|nr:pseudouridine synthase [bacterium]
MEPLELLFQDEYMVALRKPPGLHVHPTALSREQSSVMKRLSQQLDRWVYPVHRLDRATSGLMLMALDESTCRSLSLAFQHRQIAKTYLALVRGWTLPEGLMDSPVKAQGETQAKEAHCSYTCLGQTTWPQPVGPYPQARYSLVQLRPQTGRRHQLRLQLKKTNHPILGDSTYGDGDHNRALKEQLGWQRLALFATGLSFKHPVSGLALDLTCPLDAETCGLMSRLGFGPLDSNHLLGQDGPSTFNQLLENE